MKLSSPRLSGSERKRGRRLSDRQWKSHPGYPRVKLETTCAGKAGQFPDSRIAEVQLWDDDAAPVGLGTHIELGWGEGPAVNRRASCKAALGDSQRACVFLIGAVLWVEKAGMS
jgi:hypothetical protein